MISNQINTKKKYFDCLDQWYGQAAGSIAKGQTKVTFCMSNDDAQLTDLARRDIHTKE
jgi:hypothetical protein